MTATLYSQRGDRASALVERAFAHRDLPLERVEAADAASAQRIQELAKVNSFPILACQGYLATDAATILTYAAEKTALMPANKVEAARARAVIAETAKALTLFAQDKPNSHDISGALANIEYSMAAMPTDVDIRHLCCAALMDAATNDERQFYTADMFMSCYPVISAVADDAERLLQGQRGRCFGCTAASR